MMVMLGFKTGDKLEFVKKPIQRVPGWLSW